MQNLTDKELQNKIEKVFSLLEKNHPIKLGDSSKKTIKQAIQYFVEDMKQEQVKKVESK
jgi:hypothetical protein